MGSPKTPKVPQMDIGGDISKYVSGFESALPKILGSEAQFRPQFQGLNLADIGAFLGGAGGQQGIFSLGRQATQESAQQLQAAREAELAGMTGQTGAFRGFAEALSPEAAAQVRAATQASEQAYARAQGLNPQEQRMAQQQAREASMERGRIGGIGSIAAEILNREGFLAQKRQEAAGRGTEAFNLAQSFYTAPGYATLQSAPLSYSAGQQQLGLGLGAIGAGTPQLYDVGMGLNLGAAQRQNIVNAQAAGAQAKGAYGAGIMGGLGSLGGGLAGGIGAAGGAAAFFSDRRIKTDIKRVGSTDSGLPVYTFKYKGEDQTIMGVMAQDVEEVMPEAVTEIDGVKAVYYSMIS